MGVLLITHDLGVIAGRADRVVVMYAGKKAEQAPTNELFHSMHHPYAQALLTSKHQLASISGTPPDLTKEIIGCRFAPRCAYAQDDCRAREPELTIEGNRE